MNRTGKRGLSVLCCGILLVMLCASCDPSVQAPPSATPPDASPSMTALPEPTPTPTVEPTPEPTPEPEQDLLELLSGLEGSDIESFSWHYLVAPPDTETVASLLRSASAHPVEHAQFTANGSDTDSVWSLTFYLKDDDQSLYNINLHASLEENVVQVSRSGNNHRGTVHLKDETLYWLVRTCRDATADAVDQEAYASYGEMADAYYDARLAEVQDIGYVIWELTRFREAGESSVLDAKAYSIAAAFRTDPPEKARLLLAGGAYVDSQFRTWRLDYHDVYLVTIGGEPAGVLALFGDVPLPDDNPLGFFEDVEALRSALWTPGMELPY